MRKKPLFFFPFAQRAVILALTLSLFARSIAATPPDPQPFEETSAVSQPSTPSQPGMEAQDSRSELCKITLSRKVRNLPKKGWKFFFGSRRRIAITVTASVIALHVVPWIPTEQGFTCPVLWIYGKIHGAWVDQGPPNPQQVDEVEQAIKEGRQRGVSDQVALQDLVERLEKKPPPEDKDSDDAP